MASNYADIKIREALKLTGGNASQARRQIMMLIQDDPQLLHALCEPHLEGIIAHQIEHIASGKSETEGRFMEGGLPKEGENFGMDLLRAIASQDVTVFGHEQQTPKRNRTNASKQHIDAIHQLAAETRNKKKK